MTGDVSPDDGAGMAPVDDTVDHVRGGPAGRLIVEYGDYERPYSRRGFREVERVEARLGDRLRFAFRHFLLTEIHPRALAASAAAEAAALQRRFREMHGPLFDRQSALEEDDLRGYAVRLGLDVGRFDTDRASAGVLARIRRDVESGLASGEIFGTPTVFIDGVVYRGSFDAASLLRLGHGVMTPDVSRCSSRLDRSKAARSAWPAVHGCTSECARAAFRSAAAT